MKPESLPLTPPRKGFKMHPTGDVSETDDEGEYPARNVRATYAKANFRASSTSHKNLQFKRKLSLNQSEFEKGKCSPVLISY